MLECKCTVSSHWCRSAVGCLNSLLRHGAVHCNSTCKYHQDTEQYVVYSISTSYIVILSLQCVIFPFNHQICSINRVTFSIGRGDWQSSSGRWHLSCIRSCIRMHHNIVSVLYESISYLGHVYIYIGEVMK